MTKIDLNQRVAPCGSQTPSRSILARFQWCSEVSHVTYEAFKTTSSFRMNRKSKRSPKRWKSVLTTQVDTSSSMVQRRLSWLKKDRLATLCWSSKTSSQLINIGEMFKSGLSRKVSVGLVSKSNCWSKNHRVKRARLLWLIFLMWMRKSLSFFFCALLESQMNVRLWTWYSQIPTTLLCKRFSDSVLNTLMVTLIAPRKIASTLLQKMVWADTARCLYSKELAGVRIPLKKSFSLTLARDLVRISEKLISLDTWLIDWSKLI